MATLTLHSFHGESIVCELQGTAIETLGQAIKVVQDSFMEALTEQVVKVDIPSHVKLILQTQLANLTISKVNVLVNDNGFDFFIGEESPNMYKLRD